MNILLILEAAKEATKETFVTFDCKKIRTFIQKKRYHKQNEKTNDSLREFVHM